MTPQTQHQTTYYSNLANHSKKKTLLLYIFNLTAPRGEWGEKYH